MRSVLSNVVALAAPSSKRLVGLLVVPALSLALHSAPAFAAHACTNADLNGAYAYSVDATSLTVPPVGPVAILGKIALDGRGSFTGTINGSIAGNILPEVPITGTYSVAGDCTGTLTTVYPVFTAHFSLVLISDAENHKHAELLAIDAGTAGTGAVKPMFD
jgi:hypothetical protein